MSDAHPDYEKSLASLRAMRGEVFADLNTSDPIRAERSFQLAAEEVAFQGTNISLARLARRTKELLADPEFLSATVHIELPYDHGLNWHLVSGAEKAVISQRAAYVLAGRYSVHVLTEPTLAENLKYVAQAIGVDFRLSKKARKILADAGVRLE